MKELKRSDWLRMESYDGKPIMLASADNPAESCNTVLDQNIPQVQAGYKCHILA